MQPSQPQTAPSPSGWEAIHPILQDLPVSYSEVDTTGTLRAVNRAACRMHHLPAEDLLGHSIWEFVPADEAEIDRAEFERTMQTGEELPVIRRSIFSTRGGYRAHELHRRILRDSTGKPRGLASITFDVSELDAAHREAERAQRWLECAIQAIPQAVILTDALGFVRFINPSAERLIGWPALEFVGQQIEKGMPVLRATPRTGNQPLSFRMTLNERWNGDVEILTRDRQPVSVWLSASPIFDPEQGWTTGVVIVLGSPKTVVAETESLTAPNEKA